MVRGRFEGKVAIVTGGSRGIGRETSQLLVEEGAKLVLVARDAQRGEEAALQLGRSAAFVQGDVTDPRTAERAVAAAIQRFGSLDVLVNNAAVDFTSDFLATRIE